MKGSWIDSDGNKLIFKNWFPGRPSGGKSKNYAGIYNGHEWSDYGGDEMGYVFCQQRLVKKSSLPFAGFG